MPNFTQAQWSNIQENRRFLEAMEFSGGEGQIAVFSCGPRHELHMLPTSDGYYEVRRYELVARSDGGQGADYLDGHVYASFWDALASIAEEYERVCVAAYGSEGLGEY